MDDRSVALAKARQIVTQRLESLQRAGVEQLPRAPITKPQDGQSAAATSTTLAGLSVDVATATPVGAAEPRIAPPALSAAQPSLDISTSTMPRIPPAAVPLSLAQPYSSELPDAAVGRQQLLDELNTEVRACKLCRELACTRKQTVFGVGSPKPRVVFFGEAPGADEDRQGEPFVGRAGQLLTKIIEACGWKRSDVYIMNVLKCRPPDNRNPSPSETDNCRPFFERQLEILRPEYIVCVGTVPAQALLETAESVGKLRGRFHRYRDSTVLVTYHPSYLLRNPSAKKYVWDDMQMLLKKMDLPIPGKA
jgi:DNA polymerase